MNGDLLGNLRILIFSDQCLKLEDTKSIALKVKLIEMNLVKAETVVKVRAPVARKKAEVLIIKQTAKKHLLQDLLNKFIICCIGGNLKKKISY